MKDLKISKELLEKVLGRNIVNFTVNVGFIFIQEKTIRHNLNTYEFAFKCKEWARDKYDITISSSLYKNYAKSWNVDKDKSYTAKTEVEAIIKACEWILKDEK